MKEFLLEMSPSIRFKVLMIQYNRVLEEVHYFKDNREAIDYLIQRIEVNFFEPETQFVK